MKRFFLCLLVLAVTFSASAKKYPFDINVSSSVKVARSTDDGFKLLEVIAVGRSLSKAIDKAMVDAATALTFYGVAGLSGERCPAVLVGGDLVYEENKSYFDEFFKKGGFLSYVHRVNTDNPSGRNNVNTPEGRRIRIFLKVDWKGLEALFKQKGLKTTVNMDGAAGNMQKPTIMVVPEEAFCINAGMFKVNAQGVKVADYNAAMTNNDILDVISTFENLMADNGFKLSNLQQQLDALKENAALDNVLTAKDDGMVIEDDLDKLSRTARADILVKISPTIKPFGPEKKLELRVSSIDCASKKNIGAFGPVEKTSSGSTSQLLKAAVTDHIEKFAQNMTNHFEDIRENGREGSIIIKVADTCPLNIESTVEYKGDEGELGDLIKMWLSDNTIKGAFTGGKTSRVSMQFDQVRIPLEGKGSFGKGKTAIDMEGFVKTGLIKLLEKYDISVSTHAVGIGQVYLTLGGK